MRMFRRLSRYITAISLSAALIAGPLTMVASPAFADEGGILSAEVEGELAEASGVTEGAVIEYPSWQAIVATLLNFLIFAFIVAKFGGPAFNRAMADRREKLLNEMEEAVRLRKEAEAELAIYIGKLEAFDREREELMDEFRTFGENERDKMVDEAITEAARIIEDATRMANREKSQAQRDVESRLVDRALELAAADIDRQVNPMVQNRLVERSIDSFKSLKAS